ncbi:MAG TPA: PHP domain-containing protein [Methylomirabilota bacterium]|nr:PHP domain-containing protein [Methylomirabilota bacterium]
MADFVHLHNHSEYSLLDGLQKTKNMVAYAKELGMKALASPITAICMAPSSFIKHAWMLALSQ